MLSLKTPPRVLTLNEQPLDFMEDDQRVAPDSEEVVSDKSVIFFITENTMYNSPSV